MSRPRLRATISLDLDDLWTYLKTRGDPTWSLRPTYLPVFVPRVLTLLAQLNLRITCFAVGRDAELPANRELLRAIIDHGHEIGNHSYEHDCWLHRYDRPGLHADLARAEDAIARATGRRPRGFRGPGFSWSADLLETLGERGYLYDASTLPTIVGPLARAYFLWSARLSPEERAEREALFGGFADAGRPLRPYSWALSNGRRLVEIPVTTMPGTRLPFHLSYLLYLASFSVPAMKAYFGAALALCRLRRIEPSFLLHPLDLLGPAEAPGLAFFPAMGMSAERKAGVFRFALAALQRDFEIVTLEALAAEPAAHSAPPLRQPQRSFGAPHPTRQRTATQGTAVAHPRNARGMP